MDNNCQCLKDFMATQVDVIKKHLDEHKYLRKIDDRNEAVASFVAYY